MYLHEVLRQVLYLQRMKNMLKTGPPQHEYVVQHTPTLGVGTVVQRFEIRAAQVPQSKKNRNSEEQPQPHVLKWGAVYCSR
jgi:hypothetical protein